MDDLSNNRQDPVSAGQNGLKRTEKYARIQTGQRRMLIRRAGLWLSVVAVIFGAVFGIAKIALRASSENNGGTAAIAAVLLKNDQVRGNREAKVTLVEYSDFQCPACRSYHPLVKAMTDEFGDRIAFTYRHFPLPQHANARPAAEAAETAGEQGKFWEMHDMIFERQEIWAPSRNAEDVFLEYAKTLGLDENLFRETIRSDRIKGKVQNDYASGISAGANGTPTFFLNGKKIQNPRGIDEFKTLINQSILATPE